MSSRADRPLHAVRDASREPPHSLEAEEALLGALLVNYEGARAAMGELAERLAAEDFYRPAHRTVFAAIEILAARGGQVDAITVGEELHRSGTLADVGGAPFLHTLAAGVPLVDNAGYYARIVVGHARLRRLMDQGYRLLQAASQPDADPDRLIQRHARQILELAAPPPAEERPDGLTLAPEALYGLAGEIVRKLEPHTEAHPAGMLLNFQAAFGNLVGFGPHALGGDDHHYARLNVLVVGQSAHSRKGSSYSAVRRVLEQAVVHLGAC